MRDSRFDAFYFKGSKPTAVLLLHGYGGNPLEMRELGTSLHQEGYTVSAPVYSGHGYHNLRMFLNTKVSLWYDEALAAYDHLQQQGFTNIIVIGLSLGGAFTIRMAMDRNPTKIIPMSAPLFGFAEEQIHQHTKQQVDKSNDIPEKDKTRYSEIFAHQKIEISTFYEYISKKDNIASITCPVMIVQGLLDNKRFIDSANYLDSYLQATHQLVTYPNSGHVITMGQETKQLFQDIIDFIQN